MTDPRDDAPVIEPFPTDDPVEEPPDSPAAVGPIAASYAVRVHLRRIDGYPDAVEPTLREIQDWFAEAFGLETEGFAVSIRAERVDQ